MVNKIVDLVVPGSGWKWRGNQGWDGGDGGCGWGGGGGGAPSDLPWVTSGVLGS